MSIFIIAEIGINHNGDLSICKDLIDLAVDVGCDAVKFQKRDLNIVYSKEELNSDRESPWGKKFIDQKKGLEFDKKEYDEIEKFCKKIDITWFCSAWDLNSLSFLSQYNLKYNKIASAMMTDEKFLLEVAKQKKYTFISTGMCDYKIIDKAVEIFRSQNCEFELMHCTSTYPMDLNEANLGCIDTLKNKFNCDVGYSGHEVPSYICCIVAATLGATSIERHITLDRAMYGSDQAASIEVEALYDFAHTVRKIPLLLGSGKKDISLDEKEVRKKLRVEVNA